MYSISLLGPDSLIDIFPKEKKIVKKLKCSSMKAPSINIQSLDIYSVIFSSFVFASFRTCYLLYTYLFNFMSHLKLISFLTEVKW